MRQADETRDETTMTGAVAVIAPATSDVLAVIVAVLAAVTPAQELSPPPLDDSGEITYTILHLHPIDDNKIITI